MSTLASPQPDEPAVTHDGGRLDEARWPVYAGKRILDVLLAVGGLAVCAPLMAALALLIRVTSRGPAWYVQERIGRGGQPFRMYKLRTMRAGAEEETGPVWSRLGDPRLTWLGACLRPWGLDELPQLLNVLWGQMSIVGPRPERTELAVRFARLMPGYDRRHRVRPGLTGWAQVHGWRGSTSLVQRLRHDLDYVERASLALDLRIIATTPISLVLSRFRRREGPEPFVPTSPAAPGPQRDSGPLRTAIPDLRTPMADRVTGRPAR